MIVRKHDRGKGGGCLLSANDLLVRNLAICHHEALLSGDGRYLALIARHIYGPEDVLVLQKIAE